jgi:hypothetical protein
MRRNAAALWCRKKALSLALKSATEKQAKKESLDTRRQPAARSH